MKVLVIALASVGSLVSGWAIPVAAEALAAAPATLNGEVLIGDPPRVVSSCDQFGSSTIGYTVTGVAAGPYAGTFTEVGTASLGPQPINGAGPITGFTERFSISSGKLLVTGTRTLTVEPTLATNQGFCTDALISFGVAATYAARIFTSRGTFRDDGIGTVALNSPGLGGVGGDFYETFYSG